MPLPQGIGFNPPGGGNVDFGLVEGISAIRRDPQVQRAFGTGTLNLTGSVVYGIWGTSGKVVSATDMSNNVFIKLLPMPLIFEPGIPTPNPVSGGALTVTGQDTSTNLFILYK